MTGSVSSQATATPAPSPAPGSALPLAPPAILPEWVPPVVYGTLVRLAVAIVVLIGAYYVSRLVREVLARRVARRFQRPSITRTVLRGIQTGIVVLGAVIALAALGLRLSNVALSVGVFSAVLGIVLAPIVGSLINGLFVLSERAYEIGDMIEVRDSGMQGYIEDITLRYTKIFTLDNTFVVIPNGTMRERDVINYSAEDSRTRLELNLLVTYESDIPEARRLMEQSARRVEKVIEGGPDIRIGSARYPAAPTAYIDEFADHGVLITLRYWVTEPYKLLALRSRVQTNLWDALEDADVEIAYPHSHLVFDETSGELQVGLSSSDGGRSEIQRRSEIGRVVEGQEPHGQGDEGGHPEGTESPGRD